MNYCFQEIGIKRFFKENVYVYSIFCFDNEQCNAATSANKVLKNRVF